MKNFSTEQKLVVIISIISIFFLSYLVLTVRPDIESKSDHDMYKSSIDSIIRVDTLLTSFINSENTYKRDIYNFKIVSRKKNIVSDVKLDVPQIEYKWINTNELELYKRDVVSFNMFFNGKARFSINGKTQEVKVGDKIAIGKKIQKQVISGTNQATGATQTGAEYEGKILSINERSVYVDTEDKNRVVRFRLGTDSDYFARNLMEATTDQDKTDEQKPEDVPGRRIPRPGR